MTKPAYHYRHQLERERWTAAVQTGRAWSAAAVITLHLSR